MKNLVDLLDQSDSLEKGFQLAYWIVQDRQSAIDILTSALEKLSAQCRREKRRVYWRYNRSRQPIRRITRQELDAFQWLIMFQSELWERALEQRGSISVRDLIVRYVKHLVRTTSVMSSFYVCVGMNRLVYSYSTSETQAAFELITQRFPGADQYRRAKKMLASNLRERFGESLETVRTQHGEIRFKTLEGQERWLELVHKSLSMFTPWSTERLCERFRPKADLPPRSSLLAAGGPITGQDAQETIYCHVFIEPVCRGNLLAALSFSPPEAKLALPRFAMKQEGGGNDANGIQGPPASKLSAEEKALIAEQLATSDMRRQKIRPGQLRVLVDGLERARFSAKGSDSLQIELVAGAKLVEIRGEDDNGDLLLGTHLLSYSAELFESSNVPFPLNNGWLDLTVSPIPDCGDEARAILALTFRQRFRMSSAVFARVWGPIGWHVLTGATTALLAWAVSDAIYKNKITRLRQSAMEHTQDAPLSAGASYVLTPDSSRVRGPSGSQIPRISPGSRPGILILALPVSDKSVTMSYRATLKALDDRELLVEKSVPSRHTAAGQTVTIAVPEDLLSNGTYYRVVLDAIKTTGQAEEVDRYTFHFSAN